MPHTQTAEKESKKESKIVDASLFSKNKKLNNDAAINDIIEEVVLLHKKADDGLKELAEMCVKENNERR
jgi:hypothetical protein